MAREQDAPYLVQTQPHLLLLAQESAKGPCPPGFNLLKGVEEKSVQNREGGKGAYTIQCPSLRVELRNARPCLLGGVVRKEPGLVG